MLILIRASDQSEQTKHCLTESGLLKHHIITLPTGTHTSSRNSNQEFQSVFALPSKSFVYRDSSYTSATLLPTKQRFQLWVCLLFMGQSISNRRQISERNRFVFTKNGKFQTNQIFRTSCVAYRSRLERLRDTWSKRVWRYAVRQRDTISKLMNV